MGKNEVVLIDTSCWIEALRLRGKQNIRENVMNLMVEGRAAWNDMVTVELWNGARGGYEKKKLSDLGKEITCLQTTNEVWNLARTLAQKCRQAGKTIPSADLVITACALFHQTGIEHCDIHIDFILSVHNKGYQKE